VQKTSKSDSTYIPFRKEMIKMPWYTNPSKTRKVLNKIAKRYDYTTLQDLKYVLDNATETIWKKQELYFEGHQQQ
jgi:hypothetical protein